jgi:hypothetical protein
LSDNGAKPLPRWHWLLAIALMLMLLYAGFATRARHRALGRFRKAHLLLSKTYRDGST